MGNVHFDVEKPGGSRRRYDKIIVLNLKDYFRYLLKDDLDDEDQHGDFMELAYLDTECGYRFADCGEREYDMYLNRFDREVLAIRKKVRGV